MSTAGITSSYWCYSCTRFVTAWAEQDTTTNTTGGVSCLYCDGGFIEQIEEASTTAAAAAAAVSPRSDNHGRRSTIRRRRSGLLASFNPVIVLQGSGEREEEEDGDRDRNHSRNHHAFEFYYDDGSGSGLRPLPDSVSEILMGSGFERLLEQLSQIQVGRPENSAASKSAIESMPRVEISDCHVNAESHCAVCTEAFELRAEAREMPCKHIFHGDCIIPWLSMRNTCPICRFELPSDLNAGFEDEAVGMTIWRLPGGGFAVGRFNAAARREGDRILPVVLTEMDGGFGTSAGPRRVSWVRATGAAETGGGGPWRRAVRRFASFATFSRRFRSNNASSSSSSSSSSTTTSSVSQNPLGLPSNGESRVLNRSSSWIGRYLRRGRSSRESVLE